MKGQWSNAKTSHQWGVNLTVHSATLRSLSVADIDTEAVLTVLRPIWTKTPETASRVRARIEAVLDAAKAKGFRHGENPARWRGHLDQHLPRPPTLVRGHQKALPYPEAPAFMARLRETSESPSNLALQFTILTAARTGKSLGAMWAEVDIEAALWTIPEVRMKMGRAHRVPLSAPALTILRRLQAHFARDHQHAHIAEWPPCLHPGEDVAACPYFVRSTRKAVAA